MVLLHKFHSQAILFVTSEEDFCLIPEAHKLEKKAVLCRKIKDYVTENKATLRTQDSFM